MQKRFTVELKNKFAGNINIQIQDEIERVYDLGKRSLLSGQSKFDLDISNLYLKSGVYILRVYSSKTKEEAIKLVIQ